MGFFAAAFAPRMFIKETNMKKTALVLAAALAALVLVSCNTAGQKKAKLQAYDILALPGETVTLRAKLEERGGLGMKPDLEGELVLFHHGNGSLLGKALTDDNGWADLKYAVADKPGSDVSVDCSLAPESEYATPKATLLLAVRDGNATFLVSDLDHTVADVSSLGFLVKSNKSVPTLPGAPEALTRLAKIYSILYLTARDDAFMNHTKSWLRMKGFPPGPVFFWDLGGKPFDSGDYKTEALAKLKKRFPGLACGVGDKVHDVEAYLANGMRAFLIGDEPDEDAPEKAEFVKSWKDVEKKLNQP